MSVRNRDQLSFLYCLAAMTGNYVPRIFEWPQVYPHRISVPGLQCCLSSGYMAKTWNHPLQCQIANCSDGSVNYFWPWAVLYMLLLWARNAQSVLLLLLYPVMEILYRPLFHARTLGSGGGTIQSPCQQLEDKHKEVRCVAEGCDDQFFPNRPRTLGRTCWHSGS